jgi:HAD superfamily hydrolase (TIGR01509 family)
MSLKVVLFDFNGVILDDEPLHEQLIQATLLSENLRCPVDEVRRFCLGRSDRACLTDLFHSQGRVLTATYIDKLLQQKATAYQERLQALDPLPIFPGVAELVTALQAHSIKLGIVSGARRAEIETVLQRANLRDAFELIVATDDISTSKPDPEGYQQAIAQFNARDSRLSLRPQDCLAIEDSFPGLEAAHHAKIPVVGVAHTYPFHMMQRRANWAVDSLAELEVPRLLEVFSGQREGTSSMRSEALDPTPQHG